MSESKKSHSYLYPIGYPCPVCESQGHQWRPHYVRWYEESIDKVISVDLRECERCERLERRWYGNDSLKQGQEYTRDNKSRKFVWILAETETGEA